MHHTLRSLGMPSLPVLSERAHARARRHAFALIAVAAVFVGKRVLFADPAGAGAFLLFDVAIAIAALRCGLEPALAATLAGALLGFRELADREISTLSAVLLFAAQGAAVAAIVDRLRRDGRRIQAAFEDEQRELDRTRADMRSLEQRHAAASREMSDLHERFRAKSIAEQEAVLGQLDATAEQLQRLETLTDPALSELPTRRLLDELLRRIQATLGADTTVLVDARDPDDPAVFGPDAAGVVVRRDALRRAVGPGQRSTRVHLVQNDPARLAETSVIAWRTPVATLVSVPVVCAGISLGVIEIAMQRARRWTDWDTALLRVVADRSAWVLLTSIDRRAGIARRA